MKAPALIIVGPRRQGGGRRPIYDEPVDDRMVVRTTRGQKLDLMEIAAIEGRDLSAVVRDACNEYVADSRERKVFVKPDKYQPE